MRTTPVLDYAIPTNPAGRVVQGVLNITRFCRAEYPTNENYNKVFKNSPPNFGWVCLHRVSLREALSLRSNFAPHERESRWLESCG